MIRKIQKYFEQRAESAFKEEYDINPEAYLILDLLNINRDKALEALVQRGIPAKNLGDPFYSKFAREFQTTFNRLRVYNEGDKLRIVGEYTSRALGSYSESEGVRLFPNPHCGRYNKTISFSEGEGEAA